MTEIFGLTKTIILRLALITLAAGLMPVQVIHAGESGKECPESVLDVGMPELEPEYALPEEYDKKNLFRTKIESLDSGDELFVMDGISLDALEVEEPDADITFSTDEGISEYEAGSLEKGDILKAVPSISTEDDKTLGILVPPFAYFSKKF